MHILELGLRFGSTNLMFLVDLLFLLACLFLFICCKIKIKDNDDFMLMVDRSAEVVTIFSFGLESLIRGSLLECQIIFRYYRKTTTFF